MRFIAVDSGLLPNHVTVTRAQVAQMFQEQRASKAAVMERLRRLSEAGRSFATFEELAEGVQSQRRTPDVLKQVWLVFSSERSPSCRRSWPI
jgi:hypothetical protein